MTQITPESIKNFFEQAASAYGDAWKARVSHDDGLAKRNVKALIDLADARVASLNEMRVAKTFNQAFEAHLAFEEKVREELGALQEAHTESWEQWGTQLKGIFTPSQVKAKAPLKKAA